MFLLRWVGNATALFNTKIHKGFKDEGYHMKLGNIALFILLTLSGFAHADYRSSVDEDTCWDAKSPSGGSCISATSRWSEHTKGKVIAEYTNNCDHRIYLRMCNGRNSGSDDCGASGVAPHSTKSWSTSNATGNYSYNAIGVTQGSKDWVCSGKVSNWHD
jgi:hypothetical protein|tara:strand:- start:150443 stop:150922 length:480 start_codon:yes stop_codon:yes gene_type:complete